MNTLKFLEHLRGLGVTLGAEGDELRCRAAHGVLTPALVAELRQLKAEVLAYVGQTSASDGVATPAIPRAARDSELPLSFGQQRLWFLDRLTPGNPAYNVFAAASLTGPLDVGALQHSLTTIANRHEVLRTVFRASDRLPVQVILPPADVPLPEIDLSGVDPAARDAQVLQVAEEHARRPFDLSTGPLLCAALIRISDLDHVLLISMHHIVTDGSSLGILLRELASAYTAVVAGERPRLPDLSIQYADYAVWQRQHLSGATLERLAGYWRQRLAGSVGTLPLGRDLGHVTAPLARGAKHRIALSPSLTQALVALSRREGITLFMTLMSALDVLLARYTGECDVSVGFPIANRTHPSIEPLIGFFANTLVLRQDVGGNLTFRELARRVRGAALDAFTHQDMPFDYLTEILRPDRDLGRNPLFPVMFAMQNDWLPPIEFAGVRLRLIEIDNQSAKLDLNFTLSESAGILQGWIQYRHGCFAPPDITRMAGHLRTLLEGIVANPKARIDALPLLTERERRQFLAAPAPITAPPRSSRIDEAFDIQAAATPDRIAVACDGISLTYRELHRRATRLAARLGALGVGPDVPVGICLERSVDMMTAILATFKAGGAYVPLDPAAPRERLAFMLADAQPRVVLTHVPLASQLPSHACEVICLHAESERPHEVGPTERVGSPDTLAYLIYTSGSTGVPKGVAISHCSVLNLIQGLDEAIYRELGPAPLAVGLNGPLIFDTSVKQIVQIVQGHTLHILPDATRSDPQALLARLRREPLDVLDCTPSQLRLLVDAGLLDEPACASMTLLVGGEPIDAALWEQLSAAADRRFYNLYGPTECTVDATACRVQAPADPTIGRPLANVRAYVLDRHWQPVPIGLVGELSIGGAGVGRGYYKRAALTAESFVPDPFASHDGARMYRTRDVVRRLDTGDFEFVGRADRLVKVRGHRVELEEIEEALRRHPRIAQAAVVFREIGPDDARLLGYVVPSSTARPPMAELQRFLRDRLPAYMVPPEFVVLDAMPMNEHGKTDYRRLPSADHARIERPDRVSAPRDLVELELVRIWEELLNVRPVGITDNFFELGGHSFLAVVMVAKITHRFGRDVGVSALFQHATIEQLAGMLRHDSGAALSSPLVPIQSGGTKPAFFCVHPVGGNVLCYLELAEALGSDQPFYGLQAERSRPGEQPPSIVAMASRYVDEIRRIQPCGPYHVGGWSMGGVVAFEMARQLEAAGEPVALVALLDSRAPGLHGATAPATELSLLKQFATDLAARAGIRAAVFEPIWSAIGSDRDERLLEAAIAHGVLPPDVDTQHLRNLLNAFVVNLHAERAYTPSAARVELTLIQSAQTAAAWAAEPTVGWSVLTDRGVRRYTIPGTHYSIMRRPHVEALARTLAAALAGEFEADEEPNVMFHEAAPLV